MYCFIYGESKLFILYMNIVYAFIIIDLIYTCEMPGNRVLGNMLHTGI